MKRTRVGQFVERLTAWRAIYWDLRDQPILALEYEISVEEARRRWPDPKVKWEVHSPLEVEVDPWPEK
jgi:hypothetical protein